MKIKTIFLSLFIASLTMLSGCSALMKDTKADTDPVPPPKQVVAKVLIHLDGTYSLVSGDDMQKPGAKCRIKTNAGKGSKPRCTGIGNGNVEQILSIPLLRTKGSVCWITYDSDNFGTQICWPPLQ